MLVQSAEFRKVLPDKLLLIDLIDRLLTDLLSETKHLPKGSSAFHCKQPPAISVSDYLKTKFANCSPSVFVVALIYIDRLQESLQGLLLNYYCVHRLLICTLMIAAKYLDDFFYKNQVYAKIGGISKLQINELELQLLQSLNYHLHVSEKEFSVYIDRLDDYQGANENNKEK